MLRPNPRPAASSTRARPGHATPSAPGPKLVTVPDVVGLSQADAKTAINVPPGSRRTRTPSQRQTSPPAASCQPIRPPTARSSWAPRSRSSSASGPPPVTVPDVVGLRRAAAETAITDAGLTSGEVSSVEDASQRQASPCGEAIKTEPAAGSESTSRLDRHATPSAPGPKQVTVPDVMGLSRGVMPRRPSPTAGLVIGESPGREQRRTRRHRPQDQDPAADSQVDQGSPVTSPSAPVHPRSRCPTWAGQRAPTPDRHQRRRASASAASTNATNGNIPAADAVKTEPAAGSEVESAPRSRSSSAGPKQVTVPDIVGSHEAPPRPPSTMPGSSRRGQPGRGRGPPRTPSYPGSRPPAARSTRAPRSPHHQLRATRGHRARRQGLSRGRCRDRHHRPGLSVSRTTNPPTATSPPVTRSRPNRPPAARSSSAPRSRSSSARSQAGHRARHRGPHERPPPTPPSAMPGSRPVRSARSRTRPPRAPCSARTRAPAASSTRAARWPSPSAPGHPRSPCPTWPASRPPTPRPPHRQGLSVTLDERTNGKIPAGNAIKTDPAAGRGRSRLRGHALHQQRSQAGHGARHRGL